MNPHLVRIAVLALAGASACALLAIPRAAHGQAARCEFSAANDRHEVPAFADRRTDIVRDEADQKPRSRMSR